MTASFFKLYLMGKEKSAWGLRCWQERLCKLGMGEDRGKGPTNISSGKSGIN